VEVHIPEPEEGYYFDKIKKKNPKTRWRLLFFLIMLAVVISGLIINGFSFDFSKNLPQSRIEKYIKHNYEKPYE
jgi:hypothetical protein